MKTVLLLLDTLNRHFLPMYGDEETLAPNFIRLAERSMRWDNFYCCSMPCMPARREMHTGRPNFLERGWSPLEPFDHSLIRDLKAAGVYTHIITDHFHYWETGGCAYLNQYNSYEMLRGQQGDLWLPYVGEPELPDTYTKRKGSDNFKHDWINRQAVRETADLPCAKVFARALDFLEKFQAEDKWFLTIESFSPHEPFFTSEEFLDLYPEDYSGKLMDWPDYGENTLPPEVTAHVRRQYRAMLSMTDHYLGQILDCFDRYDLWRDTALILYTDHGFMLGEHGLMGKNIMSPYEEITHLPFFLHDPRFDGAGRVMKGLANSLNLAPTLADLFAISAPLGAQDLPLRAYYEEGRNLHEQLMFGYFGGQIGTTDGRYTLFKTPRAEQKGSLYNYTLAPAHMRSYFSAEELAGADLVDFYPQAPVSDKGIKVLKVPAAEGEWYFRQPELLFDLREDPAQNTPLENPAVTARLEQGLRRLFSKYNAPRAFYARFGL